MQEAAAPLMPYLDGETIEADPPLTTIEEPFSRMRSLAAEELIREIEEADKRSLQEQVSRILPVKLVVRKSTGFEMKG